MNAALQPTCAWDVQCILGEGCVWLPAEQTLYFVDIKGKAVHAYTPATAQKRSWPMPEKIGWLIPKRSGGWIAGLQSGVVSLTLDTPTPAIQWLHRLHPEGSPMRLNDAKADAQGRVWFGSMHNVDDTQKLGKFYRLDPDGHVEVVDEGYGVTNGPTFSLDGHTLFHTDSAAQKIYAFDVSATGSLTNKRLWLQFSAADGYPDGMTTDARGHIWIAHWSAGVVSCHDPASAAVRHTIPLDAPLVTNVCFGGETLQDLYITSARVGLTPEVLARQPLSGALFVVKSAGQGLPVNYFGG